MNTIYKSHLAQALNIHSINHPVQKEIEKIVGTITLVAKIEEDKQALETFKHVQGLVAYKCTLTKDSLIIGEGRATAVVNRTSKYVDKTIRAAYNGSLLDAVAKSLRMLDAISTIKPGESYKEVKVIEDTDCITAKQKDYLLTLIKTNVAENKQSELEKQVSKYSRDEADRAIKSFISNNQY